MKQQIISKSKILTKEEMGNLIRSEPESFYDALYWLVTRGSRITRIWIGDEDYRNGHFEDRVKRNEFQYEKSHDAAWDKLIKLADMTSSKGADAIKVVYNMDKRYYEDSCKRFNASKKFYKGTQLETLLNMVSPDGNLTLKSTVHKFNSLSMTKSVSAQYAGHNGVIIHVNADSVRKRAKPVRYSRIGKNPEYRKDKIGLVHQNNLAIDDEVRVKNDTVCKVNHITILGTRTDLDKNIIRKQLSNLTTNIIFIES